MNVHAVGEVTRDLYEQIRQRAPSVDLTDETWRKAVWRAAQRLAEAREDELLGLLEAAPRKAAAADG